MASEIERKYLVRKDLWKPKAAGVLYRQGYLSSAKDRVVRARIAGEAAYLTVKGVTAGITRLEFEYSIPVADAAIMLERICERPLIEKTRYREDFEGHCWEIDEFHGDNAGLTIAEIELGSDAERYALPPWITQEVSHDPRYYNSNLGRNPYKNWKP
jgi:CYTH domain-containing protein